MANVTFFVEGKADRKFLLDYVKKISGDEEIKEANFILIESNTEAAIIKGKVHFEKSTAQGKINLLIFDADSSHTNTNAELNKIKTDLPLSFETFLFPNNSDSGNLETLLEKIINPRHQSIFDCFEGYQSCLSAKSKSYRVPATKTKIYAYVDTLVSRNEEKLAKEENRNYRNPEHWNLDAVELKPLKDFLELYIK